MAPLMFFVQCCKSSRFCHLLHDKNSAIFIRLNSCAVTMQPPPPHGFKRTSGKTHIFSRLQIMKLKTFEAKNLDITDHSFHSSKFLRKMSLNDQFCYGFTRPTLPTKRPERRVSSLGNPIVK